MDPVGRYQILEELGRGAHGVVYKALDPAIGRTIAIKAIAIGDIDTADRERVREGILREARLAGTLSHPSIVTVFDVVDSRDAAYIVMEFVDGESLESAIAAVKTARGILTRNGFLAIFRQVAHALDYAHRKGVIHRDVKPANIVLTGQRMDQTGELIAKITDFGVAKFASHEATRQLGGSPALVGTPNYMSPEQVEGTNLSGASDQFSLAGIAYEVLTGQRAFAAHSLEALLYHIRHESEEPVNTLNIELSPTVAKVMQRALAKNPDDRFTSCGEFAGALEFALGDSPRWTPGGLAYAPNETLRPVISLPSSFDDLESSADESSWTRRLALLVGLCLAVGLALVLIVRMNSGSPIPTQIVETKGAPLSPPPPSIDELKGEPTPAVVKTPNRVMKPDVARPPLEPAKKKPVLVRQVKQITASAEVQFSTDPPSANVVVDGMNSCLTPCSFALAPGRHTLAASLAGFGMAHKIFKLPEDTNVFVPLVKSVGVLLISSEPAGASVNVDGQLIGRAPLTLRLSPGAHRISVWDGIRWHEESVQISSDEVRTRLFRF